MEIKQTQAIQLLQQQKLLPLYYHNDAGVSVTLMQTLYEAGIHIIEYTARGVNALPNFKALKEAAQQLTGMQIGIGTIKTAAQAKSFIDAGADFITCPTIKKEVAEITHKAGLLWIPGCMTPTEIAEAEESGATIVKIFPGNLLGPAYISAIRELFPNIKFMTTGGVAAELNNLQSWFDAGVVAVGIGSKLFTLDQVRQKDYAGIKVTAQKALLLVEQVTKAV